MVANQTKRASVTDHVKSGGSRLCLSDCRCFTGSNRLGGLLPRRAIGPIMADAERAPRALPAVA
jgi:hypothetical protein